MTIAQQKTIEELDKRIAELEYQNSVLRHRNEKLAKEVDMKQKPLNGDQTITLWQQSRGHAMRFAALIESYHGITNEFFKVED